MIEVDGYSSHKPILIDLLDKIKKPKFIELGVGFGSTPSIIEKSDYSEHYDTDYDWLKKFDEFNSENHIFKLITNFNKFEWVENIFNKRWDIALVDNAPGESRQSNLLKLRDSVDFIICHDTEEVYKPAASDYRWDFSQFKYHYVYTKYNTYTTVVSNFHPYNYE